MAKAFKKSTAREYLESIVIAVILALFIRTFVVQAFKIPTGSMENNLLIGDHLLVNKFVLGPTASPIERALLEGDSQTGISIMQMDAGLDTGAVISAHEVQVGARDTAGMLADRLSAVGAEAIVETLKRLERDGRVDAVPQVEEGASYARKISRDDAAIDWHASALATDRQVRALNPVPGAFTVLDGKPIKIWASEPAPGRFGAPGTVVRVDGALIISCGEGALAVRELQRAGGRRLSAADFLAGYPIATGVRVGETSVR